MDFGKLFSRQKYLVSDALEDYRRDFVLRDCRSETSLRSVAKALNAELGALPVRELTIANLRLYQSNRRASGRAAATVNKELALLSAALNLAAANEIIAAVPKFPRRLPAAAPRQGFLERDDYLAIRRELPDWGKLILDFGWYSGWRRNEILGLRRDEVDLRAKAVRLHPSRSKNKDSRLLPLKGFGLVTVEAGLSALAPVVFTRAGGKPVFRSFWGETWRAAAIAAGRPDMLFHDLRRSVCRRLELAGVPRKTAMAWVGHKTESVYRRYSISVERDLAPAADRMLRFMEPESADGKVVSIFSR